MKLSQLGTTAFVRALFLSISFYTLIAQASTVIPVPPGLNPGDEYRLVFVTSNKIAGTSSNITTYNNFVSDAASDAGLGATWRAIASTSTVSARQNTGIDSIADFVPIYKLDGTLVASSYHHLWAQYASLLAPINVSEKFELNNTRVWTGTNSNGGSSGWSLGRGLNVTTGISADVDKGWISNLPYGKSANFSLYAASGVLSVQAIPIPATAWLFGSALAGLSVLRRKRS